MAQPFLTPKRDHLNFDYMNRVNKMNLKYRIYSTISRVIFTQIKTEVN